MYRSLLSCTTEYQRIATSLETVGSSALFGLPPAARAQMYATLAQQQGRSLCIVTADEASATRFAADITALGVKTGVFPARDFLLRPIEGISREYEHRRLSVLGGLVSGRLGAVCVSAEALLQFTVPKAEFCTNTLTLKPAMEYGRDALIARLYAAGYIRRHQVEGAGQFSVRGDIVDIYPPDVALPARLEYWGDEIDTISSFDLLTQRRTEGDAALKKLHISPAREVLFGDTAQTYQALSAALAKAKGKRKTTLSKAMAGDLASLDAGIMPEAMDKYLGMRYPAPATLLDYFQNPILVLDEVNSIREAQKATQFRRNAELEGLLQEGILTPELSTLYLSIDDLMQMAAAHSSLLCENFIRSMPDVRLKELIDSPAHTLPNWGGNLNALIEDLDPLLEKGYAVSVFAGTPKSVKALCQDLTARNYRVSTERNTPPKAGQIQLLVGHLSGGASLPFAKYACITARRTGLVLGEGEAPQKRRKNKNALSSLTDIKAGDFVVHHAHGIGLYLGIERLTVENTQKDYLKVQYAGSDTLYVPVTQLDLLSHYTAPGEAESVKLAKLGGTEWQKTRGRVKKATEEMAKELIELYARRQKAEGHAFMPDGEWQRDFETRFEYDETDDQLTSAAEIKADMEKHTPMDRLLCGDVGVGKTEVALRAAFKAMMGGKQVALLAPTTLLAWQHYNSILSRMQAFPVKVGLLSRFRTAKQQRETLGGLRRGEVDIVVGTHRLLSKDVVFHDLGLVIVDEEQRFGVKHKERLKENFIGADILTLSATPIPRTLNMAMSGIRDMSTIEQPPFERQPVETYVLEYDKNILAEAIKKELARGGQCYYLHNRVGDIEQVADKVAQMVPGARVGIAHGKMTENELSDVWQKLLDAEIDVLVCTTLIETGVDVRNCNTLIVEQANRMGLAQLYQIRGRVGRSGRKAYAYLTFQREGMLSEVAEKRLSAIREFTSFGSGFRIAMRDLQIRGAGNLLGHSQHGHMEAVGYELYIKMLNDAIALAKGEPIRRDKSGCLIDVQVNAYIPERYIEQPAARIEAYKRIAAVQTSEDGADVLDELIDRYGSPPETVSDLVAVSLLRVMAAEIGVYKVLQRQKVIAFHLETLTLPTIQKIIEAFAGRVTPSVGSAPYLSVTVQPDEKPLALVKAVVEVLSAAQETLARP
ncbi:MAG: transcription-repair coupling factor [Faecalibacterium sp.]